MVAARRHCTTPHHHSFPHCFHFPPAAENKAAGAAGGNKGLPSATHQPHCPPAAWYFLAKGQSTSVFIKELLTPLYSQTLFDFSLFESNDFCVHSSVTGKNADLVCTAEWLRSTAPPVWRALLLLLPTLSRARQLLRAPPRAPAPPCSARLSWLGTVLPAALCPTDHSVSCFTLSAVCAGGGHNMAECFELAASQAGKVRLQHQSISPRSTNQRPSLAAPANHRPAHSQLPARPACPALWLPHCTALQPCIYKIFIFPQASQPVRQALQTGVDLGKAEGRYCGLLQSL